MLGTDHVTISLTDATGRSITEIGGKASNLAALLNSGFPVPDGFVITAAAFASFVETNRFDVDTPPETVRDATLDASVISMLALAMERLGSPVAVRSSGVAEDLADASYAGQYQSVLEVNDLATAQEALLECWASAFDPHVLRYHAAHGGGGVPGMAVLVQRMVSADAAGVAFTANPVNGDRGEVVINATAGLGDRLVAGEVDGEHWSVTAGGTTRAEGSNLVLTPSQAGEVAQLARKVEAHFGAPQDIEWAFADDGVHLLQARPITTLSAEPIEVPVNIPDGYWEREGSHAPRPWSPLTSSFFYDVRNPAMREMMSDFGLLVEALEFREIGGWEYTRLVPIGGKDRPAPPAWLMAVLAKLMPPMRARVARAIETVDSDHAGALVDSWHREWHPELVQRLGALRSVDLSSLTDEALVAHLDSTMQLCRASAGIHFQLHAAVCLPLAELAFASQDLLGWEPVQVWDLLAGLSHQSTEPSRRLAELAAKARTRAETRSLLQQGDPDALDRIAEIDPDFATDLTGYLNEYGCRTVSYDIADPTLAEIPELTLGLIVDQIARGFDIDAETARLSKSREETIRQAREVLEARSPTEVERWERALAAATSAYPIREDNEFFTVSAPLAQIRYAVLEIGRRLVERGQIASRDDVFFLRLEELPESIVDGSPRHDLAHSRRGERAWVEAHPGPASYGKKPGGPPSFDALPPQARFVNRALLWYTDQIFEAEQSANHQSANHQSDRHLRGVAASGGTYSGPVRVVRDEAEFGKLHPGDVLVCPITSPVWSVLFPTIGALVTDTGGVLSHPAIIAREYGIPAVVATGNATELLQDGQTITVDGTTGRIDLGLKNPG